MKECGLHTAIVGITMGESQIQDLPGDKESKPNNWLLDYVCVFINLPTSPKWPTVCRVGR